MDEAPSPEAYAAARALAARAPEPARVGEVRAGTAGWVHPSLVGGNLFYPRGTSESGKRLAFYGRHFSLVEVDSTFYTLLAPSTVERWAEVDPSDPVFHVKAGPVLTTNPP